MPPACNGSGTTQVATLGPKQRAGRGHTAMRNGVLDHGGPIPSYSTLIQCRVRPYEQCGFHFALYFPGSVRWTAYRGAVEPCKPRAQNPLRL
ncbi:hypothetical protein NDU88_002318 [Pleurodeles waltl]|uniref:Uncharacterized protein n=1 Tax=Pleurodeles waltl TaxID=8319 RepID=A0AAV7R9P9_PLEWA|nr:hypothetical protein NDU88_002318 [Pleurodeles waltl]